MVWRPKKSAAKFEHGEPKRGRKFKNAQKIFVQQPNCCLTDWPENSAKRWQHGPIIPNHWLSPPHSAPNHMVHIHQDAAQTITKSL